MCPEITRRLDYKAPAKLSFTKREMRDLASLAIHHFEKRKMETGTGYTFADWLEEEVPYGIICPISRSDSGCYVFWFQTQLISPVEAEPLVWWLCKLGRLPFDYKHRRVARERVTNSVLLDPVPTRSMLRGFGNICLSTAQVEKIIASVEGSLARGTFSSVAWSLDTSPTALSAELLQSGGDRPMGEYIWAEFPSDECNSVQREAYEHWTWTNFPSTCKQTKDAKETWLCPVDYALTQREKITPFESFLDPVIVLGSSLHALRQREDAWPLRLREEFKEIRRIYEYAARLLTVRSSSELASALKERPSLSFPAPSTSAATEGQDGKRVFVSHPSATQPAAPFQSLGDEGAYAQAVRLAACSIDEGDPEAWTKTLRPMSLGEAALGDVYDKILLVLEEAWSEGQFAMADCTNGWAAIWPQLNEPHRQRLEDLFAQKGSLLFELQSELNIGVCQCPLDAPAQPEEWLH